MKTTSTSNPSTNTRALQLITNANRIISKSLGIPPVRINYEIFNSEAPADEQNSDDAYLNLFMGLITLLLECRSCFQTMKRVSERLGPLELFFRDIMMMDLRVYAERTIEYIYGIKLTKPLIQFRGYNCEEKINKVARKMIEMDDRALRELQKLVLPIIPKDKALKFVRGTIQL